MERCINGHIRTPENTYVHPATGWRQCRECRIAERRAKGVQPKGKSPMCQKGLHEFTPENTHWASDGSRRCKACARETDRRRHERQREKRNVYQRARLAAMTPEAKRDARLRASFGMTLSDYEAILASQGGGCAICGSTTTRIRTKMFFAVDHDHRCCPRGRACDKCRRGLLCGPCNVMLGNARDRPEVLIAGAKYLSNWQGAPPS